MALVREGNPGHRSTARLEGGVRLPPGAPEEPDWLGIFPAVRVPTKRQLDEKYPLAQVEGSLAHIADDTRRKGLAKARQDYLKARDREAAQVAQDENRRARAVARDEWRRIVPVLDAQGLLASVDATILLQHCLAVARADQAQRQLSVHGLTVWGERGRVRNPADMILSSQLKVLKWTTARLGLDPVSRDSMTARPDEDGGSPFD